MEDCLRDVDEEVLEQLKTLDAIKELDTILALLKDNWAWKDYIKITKNKITISTGGWSQHEAMIDALMENTMFWMLYWYSSTRGGHYVFKLKRIKEK
jgi:hypothetical protein